MVATVQIVRHTGAGPTATAINGMNTRANAEDAHSTAGTTNPIKVPAAGTNYSFWVVTRLNVTITPAGSLTDVKWYADGGTFGTGVTGKMNTATGYVQATGTVGTTGDQLTTGNYATLAGAPTDMFGFTSISPKLVTGSITNPSTGEFGDRVVYQIEVGTTAQAGATDQRTITWQYDET